MPARSLATVAPVGDLPRRTLAEAVAARVGAARFGLWFAGHARFVPLGSEVVVVVRTRHTQDWLEATFGTAVREAAAEVYGPGTGVKWVVDEALFAESVSTPAEDLPPPAPVSPRPRAAAVPAADAAPGMTAAKNLFGDPLPPPKPRSKRPVPEVVAQGRPGRRWKLLHEFVVGPCNRVAHAAALSVVEDPGDAANPLVLHGPVGTGKTHLLEGIYAGLKRRGDQRPCFVTAEEFTTRFVAASHHGRMAAFRRQFRECTALLLDDLHFLAGKKATQAEFLHTFDALVSDGRQVVVTLDCHPRLADELMPELVDRLLGGAVWGLLPPDPETRLAVLRKKASGANPPIPDAVLKLLAGHLRGNVRELEGAVHTVRHYAKVTGRAVDAALAREALGDLLRHAVRVVTPAEVDAAVCSVLGLAAGTLQSPSRSWAVTHPRMVAVYLCRKHTAATYSEISRHFGAKTHSTAVAAEKKVRQWLERDAVVVIGSREWRVKDLIDRVERELQR